MVLYRKLSMILVSAILHLLCAEVMGQPSDFDFERALKDLITTYAPELIHEGNHIPDDIIYETIRARAYGQNVTTPEVCYEGHICGFQLYENYIRKHIDEFTKYCNCPEGFECVPVGENMMQRVFIHGCVKTGAPRKTTPMPSVGGSSPHLSKVTVEHTKAMESTTAAPAPAANIPEDINPDIEKETGLSSDHEEL